MKKLILWTTAALILSSGMALAADMATKAPAAAAPAVTPNPFDIAFGAAIMTDYNFRGITQSNHKPSVNAYFEPRYNFNSDWQIYGGLGGYSIEFPNNAAAEIDIYGGIRPTFGKLALDFGVWYYYYPDGQCFNVAPFCTPTGAIPVATLLPNGNVAKADRSFYEWYGKATYTVNDN